MKSKTGCFKAKIFRGNREWKILGLSFLLHFYEKMGLLFVWRWWGQAGEAEQAGLHVLTLVSFTVQIYTIKLFHRIFFLRKNAKMV